MKSMSCVILSFGMGLAICKGMERNINREGMTMTTLEMQAEALQRATNQTSVANYASIYHGFIEKGIPEAEIQPRVNVFTFNAWKALGRSVRKGEHGVKVITYVTTKSKVDDETGEEKGGGRIPWTTTVFHVSQTEPAR